MSDNEADDEFQDAQEELPPPSSLDFETATAIAKQAIYYYFSNEFEKSRKTVEPYAHCDMYCSLGTAVFAYLDAVLTFERKYIEKASKTLKQCMAVCSKRRRHTTAIQNIGKIVKRPNYDFYTIGEVHAELCYTEALLFKSMLSIIEDETLVSFVKAGFRIRNCFLSYKDCLQILETRKWESKEHKMHFESGVRLGVGTFNLMISLLPTRTIKLLEFVGFSGDKNYGLNQLLAGYEERGGLRQILCAMSLLFYNTVTVPNMSDSDGDLKWCDQALDEQLAVYPQGAWFLFLKGRLEFMKGNFKESVEWYTKSWESPNLRPEFHNLCFWELMWVHSVQRQWESALKYAEFLSKQSNWSRTIYFYQQAAIMLMMKPSSKSEEQMNVDKLMAQVPTYKQRIAGKSLPMEKFLIKKSERYFAQKKYLVLPIYELLYLWNCFRIIGKSQNDLLSVFKCIEEEEVFLKNNPKNEFQVDNEALILLLKGACFRQLKLNLQSQDCLRKVLEMEKQIRDDTYLLPFATVELALLAKDQGDTQVAISLLENAKKNFTGYSLESRLHFRIHCGLMELNSKEEPKNGHE
ncbi:tetratricopeptide repeat protein 39B-like [Phymastichus coffea]|uniref:tetratricopeptide repeat protein 39B-like n=1 Tax=Phymastichus coffea TaxID=108790 RepID=UPI00273AEE1F|nr:tetratricopeptide repeat protein 39B-like [Phymastichus coffea]XP_058809442.1 tetratricopeptide repeat protein 39B-like [Phymastichus coffea]XP_058809443.1 tetratricopeptide repeat protein 39B-like [Phymastichus coffea]XP_058809444.1 tetratricopeptide repeat protein 39B-like [Phymastichus coffea]